MDQLKKLILDILGVNSGLNKVYEGFNKDTEFIKVNPVKLLTSGKITSDDIGKTVYLSNSVVTCQEWQVADVNRDDTSGTVDLFSKYTLDCNTEHVSANGHCSFDQLTTYYANSFIRTWLNSTVFGGFAVEAQNVMKVQNFPSNEITLSDKVKCPAVKEVGFEVSGYMLDEGTIYPIFGVAQRYENDLAIYKTTSNMAGSYWTRSRSTRYSQQSYFVGEYGGLGNVSVYYADCAYIGIGIIGCIRF